MFCLNAVDVKCPICGTINKSLDLEETDGWMECESCGEVTQQIKYVKTRKDYQFAGSFAPGISAVIELESTSWLEKQPDTEQEAWVRKARIWKVGILIVLLTLLYMAQWLIIRLVPRKNMLRLEIKRSYSYSDFRGMNQNEPKWIKMNRKEPLQTQIRALNNNQKTNGNKRALRNRCSLCYTDERRWFRWFN